MAWGLHQNLSKQGNDTVIDYNIDKKQGLEPSCVNANHIRLYTEYKIPWVSPMAERKMHQFNSVL